MPLAHSVTGRGARIGIDLGGTKTEIMVLSAQGETLLRKRVATPRQDYAGIVRTIAALVDEARPITGPVAHVGIGIPGASDASTGLIKNANTTCLIGQPLARDLAQALGLAVRLENDANCFTLSEATDGSAAGHGVVFGVILGTGVGGGWCLNGELHPGMHHIAGEWGHNPIPLRLGKSVIRPMSSHEPGIMTRTKLPWHEPFLSIGRACYCGKVDCIETHLCGSGLAQTHAVLREQAIRDTGERPRPAPLWSAEDIAAGAAQGDLACRHALELYARQLASTLATVINIVDPDVIVLGGGLSNLDAIYPLVQAALPEFVFNPNAMTPVVKARHGDSSGVRGAAWL